MTEQSPMVGADLLVIPDGAGASELRIGIQVTPTLNVAGDIPLDRWPAEIARLAESVRIRFGTIAGGQITEVGSVITRSDLADFFDPANAWSGKPRRDAASAMWQDIFQPVGFQSLIEAIGEMGAEQAPATLKIASTRIADLQLFLDTLLTWHEARMPSGRAMLTEDLKGLARRMATWVSAGPSPHAPRLQARLWQDPMRERADQLEVLTQGFELLLQQDTAGNENALRFAAAFEAEVGTMFREHWIRLFGVGDPSPPKEEPPTDDWGKDRVKAASRKLSALLALPTLSHYLGLGVQLEIPRESLGGLSAGVISAEFVAADGIRIGGETAWTAFELAGDHFGPAPDPATPSSVDAFSRGLLNLGVQIDGRRPRFALRSDDVVNALLDLVQAVNNQDDPNLKRYRRGLVLYDFANLERLKEDEDRAINGAVQINYLNDLLAGFRPDFALATRGADNLKVVKERWRPVTFRSIVCKHDELDPAFYNDPLIIRIASRDHGYTAALVEEKDGALSREDEMFAWAGESLAVHAKRGKEPIVDPERDLALRLTYALPAPGSALGMPPLREGVGYACGCRLVYVNGAGLDFDAAAAIYSAAPTFVIGNAAGKPYVFPPAPLPPPDVHLGWEDPLVGANDLEREVAGETSETLVIRDGEGSARRFMTPPRGSFDSAEQQRQLDDPALKDDSPHGALSGPKGVWLFGADGKFPEARFGARLGSVRYLDGDVLMPIPLDGRKRDGIKIGSPEYQAIKYRQSRGTVVILGRRRNPAVPNAPFHPDSNGGRLRASLHRSSLEGATTPPLSTDRDFWKAPLRPADAVPIVVDLLPTPDPASLGTARDIIIVDIDDHKVNLPYLQFSVPKGETYRLRLKGDSRRGDEAEVVLMLVHAVEKPLLAPDFRPKEAPDEICSTDGIGLRAVTVTVRNDDPKVIPLAGLETWAEKVRRYEASGVDMRCWPSEEGGTTTVFTGRVDIDRKSTGVLRCEVIWKEFDEGTVSRAADGRWIRNIASETAQLFQFEVERRGGEGRVDLLRVAPPLNSVSAAAERHARVTGVPGELRTLSHAFRDGRARQLEVKIVATSAFTAFYPDDAEAPSPGEWIGRYDVESSRFSTAPRVWTDCTFRPPPPQIDRVLPLLAWDKLPDQPESCRRMAHLRIYLGEGWYASGADERLGIVLLGDDDPKTVCDYQTGRLEAYQRFISQAGSDPVRETSPVPLRIEPRHFRNAPAPVQAMLYLGGGDGPSLGNGRSAEAISPLPVTVLPFSPRFTEEDGLFCDLEFDIGDSYFPFLRLGLVRYQEHAVDHLRLSHPIAFDVQLLPERRLWVDFNPNGIGERTVVVEGPGFEVPNLGQPSHKPNALRLAILSWNETTHEWRESRLIKERLEPETNAVSYGYRWKQEFKLPLVGNNRQRFMLVVEEYERLPLDEPTGQFEDGEAIFTEVDGERLTFSCMQPLVYPRIDPK
ncbi:hypothetical protein [Pseudomonas sp. GM48]|uniref:hypothetical protein n=1 Tax=Pseudomonas sp. GM48 TaxID=1144330 RepID=UPI00026FF795|nr:hypothetical protein [Pseudomonas sp. GM48]EJM48105.1 hypothetical protein PMI28_05681 [Pseudomonas sp. GM48]